MFKQKQFTLNGLPLKKGRLKGGSYESLVLLSNIMFTVECSSAGMGPYLF